MKLEGRNANKLGCAIAVSDQLSAKIRVQVIGVQDRDIFQIMLVITGN